MVSFAAIKRKTWISTILEEDILPRIPGQELVPVLQVVQHLIGGRTPPVYYGRNRRRAA
jgi:hypothetical protein